VLLWQILAGFVGGSRGWQTLIDVGGGTFSLFLGFMPLFAAQLFVLRRHLRRIDSWVLGSAVGICLGAYAQRIAIFVSGILPATTSGKYVFGTQMFWGMVLGLFVLWGVIGCAQWLVLRRRIPHAGWWVLASALSGATSGAVAQVIRPASGDLLLPYVARWAIYGALTGIPLVLLLQKNIKRSEQRRREGSSRVSTYPTPMAGGTAEEEVAGRFWSWPKVSSGKGGRRYCGRLPCELPVASYRGWPGGPKRQSSLILPVICQRYLRRRS
jgi:hypothetical protein